jgi:23S rRNA pseudouridine2605 synthase
VEQRLLGPVARAGLAVELERGERDRGGELLAQRGGEVGHLGVRAGAARDPLPRLPRAEAGLAALGERALEELEVHRGKSGSAARAGGDRASSPGGYRTGPPRGDSTGLTYADRMRLAKYLAHAGVASRRTAEALVAEGRVTVDGELVTDPAREVDNRRRVTVDGRELTPEPRELHVLNKPAGVVSTARDTHGRPTVLDLVPSRRRLYPVGRLDADTTGLILLTNDGELANRLTHPRYEVEKTYRAEVEPPNVGEEALRALRAGLELDDGTTLPARVEKPAAGVLEIALREGRKRQVRRMCEAVGHRVVALRRIAFGPLRLGGLAEGDSRPLVAAEVALLHEATAGSSAEDRPQPARPSVGAP